MRKAERSFNRVPISSLTSVSPYLLARAIFSVLNSIV
jgi:hypothetical protein